MKNKVSAVLKQIIAKSQVKAMTIKNKTIVAKFRFLVSSVLARKNLSLLKSHSKKIHCNPSQGKDDTTEQIDGMAPHKETDLSSHFEEIFQEDGDKYHDFRRRENLELDFDDEEDDHDDRGGSVVDLMRKTKMDDEDFSLEDKIDQVAELFIRRVHQQMRMQKLESFKRFQEMLARGL